LLHIWKNLFTFKACSILMGYQAILGSRYAMLVWRRFWISKLHYRITEVCFILVPNSSFIILLSVQPYICCLGLQTFLLDYKFIVSIANNFANSQYSSTPISTTRLLATISIMVMGPATVVPPPPTG
jgi:hypothetical protein